ncbi:MAG: TraR/DksA C4-type zinc finger protein [Candidatus Moranbacteria bacterium]|nr:TraR/DksA C4-type zinc finger protein [Candidatus Moranbacteria bacterium]
MRDKKIQQELKERLLEDKKKVEGELNKIAKKEEGGDYEAKYEDYGREREDNVEEIADYSTRVSITESLEKDFKNIESALEKMEQGTYGICENCDEEIPVERLKVYPAAKDCITCKQKNEK